jgi:hypothetical protein
MIYLATHKVETFCGGRSRRLPGLDSRSDLPDTRRVPDDRGFYRVYVIELDPQAFPRGRKGRTCVYVGETADTPEERFAEHLRGYRASRIVRKYGLRLRPDLYRGFVCLTRQQSRVLEARVAARLRVQGFIVFGGH